MAAMFIPPLYGVALNVVIAFMIRSGVSPSCWLRILASCARASARKRLPGPSFVVRLVELLAYEEEGVPCFQPRYAIHGVARAIETRYAQELRDQRSRAACNTPSSGVKLA